MPILLDSLQSTAQESISDQYEHVVEIDKRLRQFVSTIPAILLREDSEHTIGTTWLGTARRTLALAAADKVCSFLYLPQFQKSVSLRAVLNQRY